MDSSFASVNLHGISRGESRYECFLALLAKFFYQPSDGCLAAGEATFGHQPVVNPLGSVVLLPRLALGHLHPGSVLRMPLHPR